MSLSKTKESQRPKPARKTSLSDREYVSQVPAEDDIALKDGIRFLPIDVIERDLDRWAWGTQNFMWQQSRDTRGNPHVSASLELLIPWTQDNGKDIERRIVGTCSFVVANYAPNSHFVAIAKSECVKNAASDLGKKFGRGLNERFAEAPAVDTAVPKSISKMKPDKSILEKFKKAVAEGDETVMKIYSDIYEFKTEENGN